MTTRTRVVGIAFLMVFTLAALWRGDVAARQAPSAPALRAAQPGPLAPAAPPPGRSATVLPDGRWLLVGGEGAETAAVLWDPRTNVTTPTGGQPQQPRAWHSATVLPDGTVLLAGGGRDTLLVETPELFDPATETFTPLSVQGAVPRASHTATLLTDGRVLMAGGSDGSGRALPTEIWNVQSNAVTATALGGETALGRTGHTATLMPDGQVRVSGGQALDGTPAGDLAIIDVDSRAIVRMPPPPENGRAATMVSGSIPRNGDTDVALGAHLTLRFSEALTVASLTSDAVTLTGPDGIVVTRIIPAEEGRLAFIWPADAFADGATYTLAVSGVLDQAGTAVAPMSITFTTVQPATATNVVDTEVWVPDADSIQNGWRTNRPPSPWESLAPLTAPPGVTAISGRVLMLDGRPLPGVTLALDGNGPTTESDRTGRFLLPVAGSVVNRRVLAIDGAKASRANRKYGFFEYGLSVKASGTTVLPFTIWMPRLDMQHVVTLPSPTTSEVVITTPFIPGLELHLPPQTVLRGRDGKVVTQVGLTPIPVDRPPFPLAKNVEVPVYFTAQPGSTYVETAGVGPKGAWLVYPNYTHGVPRQQMQFFHYDPDVLGWYVYGAGRVTTNAAQVMPDPTTRLYEFTGAMINSGNSPPITPSHNQSPRQDPVDPSTGLFILTKTDLYLPDVIPLALTRSYNSGDGVARSFGFGMMQPYGMFLWTSQSGYQQADLVLPDGMMIHYVRSSTGTGFTDAVFTASPTPTNFAQSTIAWNGNGWDLTRSDGTVYVFGDTAPLQAIRDRYGNTVTILHANGQSGNVTQVLSPNGRWLTFTYDTSNRVTQVADNIGRTVRYTYDTNGNLSTVTDPASNVTTYTYDTSHQLLTVKDGRQIVYLTNTYTNGRVTNQTLADPQASYQSTYTTDGSGNLTQTNITDPRGHVEQLTFNADHFLTSDTQAFGTSLARTTTYTRQAGTDFVTAVVDGLSRETDYAYDTTGHVLTVTQLAGTANAVTTTYTYEPLFHQLATMTDPLSHTWTWGYDATGRLTSASDPLTHQRTIVMNGAGQVTQVTDPLTHVWQIGYTGGDQTSGTNPLGAVWGQYVDAGGRVRSTTDPLGRVTRSDVDALNRPTTLTDALGGQTGFNYDANSNLLSLTDALTHATSYTYDTSDRVTTRTDPLQQVASYGYDTNNNLTQVTDRKGQITSSQYDALDRLAQVTFQDASTITYTYDAGDRLTQLVDSTNGTITRTYDGLDHLLSETTPQGSVSYTYDADGRRATMTVAGQPTVTYGYDAAHRLTTITQNGSTVALTYDNADRRSTLTFPNGIVATYGYDVANQLTSIAYTLNATAVGTLTYTYDLAGQRLTVGGSWARTGLPQAVASATYDAGNRLTTWGTERFSYDPNGNLAADGLTSYTWNARNQLVGMSGVTSASFAYDALGRRQSKTISGTATNFLYDKLNLVQELSNGTPSANLLSGSLIDETLTRSDSNGSTTLLTDAQRSTIGLADASGAVQTSYTFEPFGQTQVSGSPSANATEFASRENDGVGLYYYRSRFYSPALQRFLSEDPKGFAGGDVNLFAYVSNSPVTFVDPLGLDQTIWDFGGNGRYGPRNGNWGGSDWSGGQVPGRNGGRDGTLPPTDSADRCYMEHDRCYERCSDHRRCDEQLLRCLHNLPWDPRNWPEPPRPGTLLDTLRFMTYAEGYFGTLVNGYMMPW